MPTDFSKPYQETDVRTQCYGIISKGDGFVLFRGTVCLGIWEETVAAGSPLSLPSTLPVFPSARRRHEKALLFFDTQGSTSCELA